MEKSNAEPNLILFINDSELESLIELTMHKIN